MQHLTVGMVLGKSLFGEAGQRLLRAGYELDGEIIHRLRDTGRNAVYILEEGTEEIVPVERMAEEARSRAAQAFAHTVQKVAEAASARTPLPPQALRRVISRGAEYRNVVDMGQVACEITSVVDEVVDASAQVLDQTLIKSGRTGWAIHWVWSAAT